MGEVACFSMSLFFTTPVRTQSYGLGLAFMASRLFLVRYTEYEGMRIERCV